MYLILALQMHVSHHEYIRYNTLFVVFAIQSTMDIYTQ